MVCPLCGCEHFYVKNAADDYEMSEFDLRNGEAVFSSEEANSSCSNIEEDTEVYCDNCAWHGKFKEINK